MARTVCYSQFNLTSDRLLNDLMWFLVLKNVDGPTRLPRS